MKRCLWLLVIREILNECFNASEKNKNNSDLTSMNSLKLEKGQQIKLSVR
jgi:hypothetical protein